ncbi:capsular biosynthesis protein CpsI [bacterium]|nr:capsular biosynthesis protein CpsI [bacterium]|tara:strand:- start:232 stop:1266 length:1035 start_codon:yes stop_codon:yes gene_type:complete
MKNILVTGAAGFIGAALSKRFLVKGENVIGIDNLNSYYDPVLKKDRLQEIEKISNSSSGNWKFYKTSIEDEPSLEKVFQANSPDVVINLAAQAGVRYSITNPSSYTQSNLVGFSNLLEQCRKTSVENLIFASSSSVYGGNKKLPFNEYDSVNHPVSFYAATKKANELMAHSYSHLYQLPCTGLRFFTVYGPWGRPDMAPMIFANSIVNNKPINVFNFGKMKRDFTYIDDIVEGVYRCAYKPAYTNHNFDNLNPDQSSSFAPYRIFNIGNSQPIDLMKFIQVLEKSLKKKAKINLEPIQPGDVEATVANTDLLEDWINFRPKTLIEIGVEKFAEWYIDYHQLKIY